MTFIKRCSCFFNCFSIQHNITVYQLLQRRKLGISTQSGRQENIHHLMFTTSRTILCIQNYFRVVFISNLKQSRITSKEFKAPLCHNGRSDIFHLRPITFKQIDLSFNRHCRPTGNPTFIIRIIRSRQIVTVNHFIQISQYIRYYSGFGCTCDRHTFLNRKHFRCIRHISELRIQFIIIISTKHFSLTDITFLQFRI